MAEHWYDRDEIITLWHIARTALAGQDAGRYERMQYVKREYLKAHPAVESPKRLWLAIEEFTRVM